MGGRGVRSSAVGLPPTVYGAGDHGFLHSIIGAARERGVSAYIGDGTNRWPAVHRLDAAHLFCLALAGASAGSRLHAVAEEGVPFREIAEVIGRHLDVPVVSEDAEDAAKRLGLIAYVAGLDNPASSTATRALLGWEPTQQGLFADLDAGHYFAS
jgi:nucleoside-diphosphate-sugar epimerase